MHLKSSRNSRKDSSIQFVFHAPAARQVSLAGDFNNWDPHSRPMTKSFDGVWRVNVALTPGCHEYRFYADGTWIDDPSAERKAVNGMGTENCVITVEG